MKEESSRSKTRRPSIPSRAASEKGGGVPGREVSPPRLISGGATRGSTKSKIASSGAWKDENAFELMLRYYETPHHDTVICRFAGDKVTIAFLSSIAAMSPMPKDKRPTLQGKMV